MLKKKILVCALALLCTFCTVACGGDTAKPEDTETETASQTTLGKADAPMIKIVDSGKTEYKIVYASDSDIWAYDTAEYICDRIALATGVTLRVGADSSEPSEYEIVIGDTKRGSCDGFDAEAHDWKHYPIYVGIEGNKLFFNAPTAIDLYRNLSFVMDEWLEDSEDGKLGVSDKVCQRMMRASGSVGDGVITMLMQNVCVWGDSPNTPKERFERVYEEFRYYNADIIGVSEQSEQWVKYLEGALATEGYARLGGKNLYGGYEGDGNNIYYKTEKLDVIDWNTFWLSKTPDVAGTTLPGATLKNVATWALFETKDTGKKFVVLNTHLHAYENFAEIRAEQIEIVTNFLEQYIDEYPVYIMGDMNIEERHAEYAKVLESFYDSRDVAKRNLSGEQDTYNDYGRKYADGDYIFTGKGDGQSVLWYKVISEKRFGDYSIAANEWVSDHYGVCIQTKIS